MMPRQKIDYETRGLVYLICCAVQDIDESYDHKD